MMRWPPATAPCVHTWSTRYSPNFLRPRQIALLDDVDVVAAGVFASRWPWPRSGGRGVSSLPP